MLAALAAALAAGWIALLLAAPMLPPELSALTYAFGSLICHQRPERSFQLDAYQLPVCARCVGIYAGAALGAGAAIVGRAWRPGRVGRMATLTVVAALPTIVTVALEWLGVWHPSNVTRALAGAPAGVVVALVVTRALATVHYTECVPPRPTAPTPPRPPI